MRNRVLIILLCVIFISRLLIVIFGTNLYGDNSIEYLAKARLFLKQGILAPETMIAASPFIESPIYAMLLTPILFLTQNEQITVKLAAGLNIVFFIVAALGIYCFTRKLSGQRALGYFALLIFSILPESVVYSVLCLPDTLFLVFFIWSNYFFVKYVFEKKDGYFFFCCILSGISTLIKPVSSYYILIISIIVLFSSNRATLKQRILLLAAGIMLNILVVSPWLLRNYSVNGEPIISTKMDMGFYYYYYRYLLGDKYDEGKTNEILEKQRMELASTYKKEDWENPAFQAKVLGEFGKQQIIRQFPLFIRIVLKRHPRLYYGTGTVQLLTSFGDKTGALALYTWGITPSLVNWQLIPSYVIAIQIFSWVLLLVFYALALIGLYKILFRHDWFSTTLLLAGFFYFTISYGPLTHTRYRFDMSLFLTVIASFAFYKINSTESEPHIYS